MLVIHRGVFTALVDEQDQSITIRQRHGPEPLAPSQYKALRSWLELSLAEFLDRGFYIKDETYQVEAA